MLNLDTEYLLFSLSLKYFKIFQNEIINKKCNFNAHLQYTFVCFAECTNYKEWLVLIIHLLIASFSEHRLWCQAPYWMLAQRSVRKKKAGSFLRKFLFLMEKADEWLQKYNEVRWSLNGKYQVQWECRQMYLPGKENFKLGRKQQVRFRQKKSWELSRVIENKDNCCRHKEDPKTGESSPLVLKLVWHDWSKPEFEQNNGIRSDHIGSFRDLGKSYRSGKSPLWSLQRKKFIVLDFRFWKSVNV